MVPLIERELYFVGHTKEVFGHTFPLKRAVRSIPDILPKFCMVGTVAG